ncbi:unnamed protein product [Cuscuta campestris]|uniref:Uncharacterized protein n=1 Tax=Cuscuta campestris TaxID=132261 RepID=A0A484ML07_9ASTE|nr:unnamed protein product [Cuscuta campestris]
MRFHQSYAPFRNICDANSERSASGTLKFLSTRSICSSQSNAIWGSPILSPRNSSAPLSFNILKVTMRGCGCGGGGGWNMGINCAMCCI